MLFFNSIRDNDSGKMYSFGLVSLIIVKPGFCIAPLITVTLSLSPS